MNKSYKNKIFEEYQNYITKPELRLINWRGLYSFLRRTPISDEKYIWKYVRTLRFVEYYLARKTFIDRIIAAILLAKLRRLGYKTGFQIPPFVCDWGLTIYHYGHIIINSKCKIGKDSILNPGIVIGHKNKDEMAPKLGNNVFVGAGAKIIGDIEIGDHVIIAPNAVVVDNVPSHCVVGGIPAKIIKKLNK